MKRREFERTTPEAVGLRSEDIEWLLDELESGFTEMHGLMIMRHGKVCAEGWWAPYGPGVRHGLQSLSKTYAATAVGIACTEGLLHLDDKVIDIFPDEAPEKPSENLKKMTVRDVLCMGCGMDTMSPADEHWIRSFLATPVLHEPGTTYMYNSMGSTLLGAMVRKVTGLGLQDYLTPRLFDKIGIDAANLRWMTMPDGMEVGGGGLFATTEDNLRLMKLYTLNRELAGPQDMEGLKALGLKLKLDFILNHASVLSPQFQDLLKNGKSSAYRDFFIDWNDFWQGCGSMTEQGYIQPEAKYLEKMLFRKPGLPILMARMPDGTEEPYWNTFYQQVDYLRPTVQQLMQISGLQYSAAVRLHSMLTAALNAGQKPDEINFGKYAACKSVVINWLEEHREYLGQMDLNIKSPIVWEFYRNTLQTLAGYGASIVRLDAFAYAPKEPGEKNFLNDPATWELLDKVKVLADEYGLQLLPEIHASYSEKIYQTVADKGYMTYDFFLPGLVLDAIENKDGSYLAAWADELRDHQIHTVNMLGCHDGIPLLDLKGLLPEERIQSLIGTIVARGGMVKDLHGQKNIYYQVNATYYSALGADDDKMLLARAIQLFMPGKPQVWYLDLFAGKNDVEAVRHAGAGGHKEINRTNLNAEQINTALQRDVVQRQLDLLRLRKTHPAFHSDAEITTTWSAPVLSICWKHGADMIALRADLVKDKFEIQ